MARLSAVLFFLSFLTTTTRAFLPSRNFRTSLNLRNGRQHQALEADIPPTEKQISFVTRLASERGLTIPQEVLSSANSLSHFVDEALQLIDPKSSKVDEVVAMKQTKQKKSSSNIGDELLPKSQGEQISTTSREEGDYIGNDFTTQPPPTQKQIKFAEKLAHERGESVPEDAMNSMNSMSSYIDELLHSNPTSSSKSSRSSISNSGIGSSSNSNSYSENDDNDSDYSPFSSGFQDLPPTPRQFAFADALSQQKGLDIPEAAMTSKKLMSNFIAKALKQKTISKSDGSNSPPAETYGEVELSGVGALKRKVCVRTFANMVLIDVRDFIESSSSGVSSPTSKGISLTQQQWSMIRDNVDKIDEFITTASGSLGSSDLADKMKQNDMDMDVKLSAEPELKQNRISVEKPKIANGQKITSEVPF